MNRSLILSFSFAATLAVAATGLAATPGAQPLTGTATPSAAAETKLADQAASSKPGDSATATDEGAPPKELSSLERQVMGSRDVVDELGFRSDHVQQLLRNARHARYQERMACLDDLLSQSHAVERDAVQALHNASQAAEREDSYGVERELVHLWIYDLRSRTLLLEADECGAVEARFPSP